MIKPVVISTLALMMLVSGCSTREHQEAAIGTTEVTKWKDGKDAAISITFDDATINQFRRAMPILDSLGMKGTFFINTTDIPGSRFLPKLIGRPLRDIVQESARIPTDTGNLFERANAVRFLDIPDAVEKHNHIGVLYEDGKVDNALRETDEALATARNRNAYREVRPVLLKGELITWDELRRFTANGHEVANHTISHPRLAVLDEANMLYELEKCKEEILHQLGPSQTFSCECPFGTENERVMRYALKIHPALRNRMPEPFLQEINRASSESPVNNSKEYVQWQRGPLQKTRVTEMKNWVNTLLAHKNIWLVLTFHGVDDIGWEAKPHAELNEYFSFMKAHENNLWIAPFRDVAKYMRERMSATTTSKTSPDKIIVNLTQRLDTALYDLPLTLKTIVDPSWTSVKVKQGNETQQGHIIAAEGTQPYVLYHAYPNGPAIELTKE